MCLSLINAMKSKIYLPKTETRFGHKFFESLKVIKEMFFTYTCFVSNEYYRKFFEIT